MTYPLRYKMDTVQFTLFLMACVICQGNMANPYVKEKPLDRWPRICSGLNYCTVKPADYPSNEVLIKMSHNMEINSIMQETNDKNHTNENHSVQNRFYENDSDEQICRFFQYYFEDIYMIKDENDQIRYALNIPGSYEIAAEVQQCHSEQILEDLEGTVECKQIYTTYSVCVLSLDKSRLERVRIKDGLPTGCVAVTIEDY